MLWIVVCFILHDRISESGVLNPVNTLKDTSCVGYTIMGKQIGDNLLIQQV